MPARAETPLVTVKDIAGNADMKKGMPTLLGIGDNTVDVYIDRGWMFPGGNVVNVAAMAARLGATAAYIGCLSYDRYGTLVYDALAEEGVDLSHCRRAEGQNACALIGHENNDRRFLGSRHGIRGDFTLGATDFSYMSSFDVVHTSVHSELDDQIPDMSKNARLLSYDFSNRWTDGLRDQLAPFVDIAFISLGSAELKDCEAQMRSWSAAGSKMVVGTRGGEGSLALHDGQLHLMGIKPANVVDTLGAGDGFVTGFLLEWTRSHEIDRSLDAGARNAADICSVMGAFGHGIAFTVPPDDLPLRTGTMRA